LQVGERCTVGIEHLGEISQQIVAPA
jgi:hypothetical protein